MRITETRTFKFTVAIIIAIGNVAFYTWGDPSGAESAWEVSPWFYAMWQAIFFYAEGGFIYFGIKNL